MCGVTECPVTNLFFVNRGWQQGRESATNEDTLVTLVKQLETSSCVPAMVVQSLFGPLFLSLCVLHVDSVTFSPLEGNRVPCEPKLIILETCRLYSRLISCTRKISTLHLEFKCVCVCVEGWFKRIAKGPLFGVPIVAFDARYAQFRLRILHLCMCVCAF